jgi:hypothetical protein
MITRCESPNRKRYSDYGGRGITVCDRWHDFANFLADMGEKPTSRHSIDRINNDGNYEPENCRWATPLEQSANSRRVRPVVRSDGKRYISTSEAARATLTTSAAIVSACRGRLKTTGGFGWQYSE